MFLLDDLLPLSSPFLFLFFNGNASQFHPPASVIVDVSFVDNVVQLRVLFLRFLSKLSKA